MYGSMWSRVTHRSPLVLLFSVICLITLSGHTCFVNTAARDIIPILIKLRYTSTKRPALFDPSKRLITVSEVAVMS